MAKRAPEDELEQEGETKKAKTEIWHLHPDQARLIEGAVEAALDTARNQPIVLDLWDEDIEDNQAYAYVPASRAVGVWLCKTLLELLHPTAPLGMQNHMALTAAIAGQEAAVAALEALCASLGQPGITSVDALGRFFTVCVPGDAYHEVPQLDRTALHWALYHQKGYTGGVYTTETRSSASSSSDDDEEESNSTAQ